MTVKIIKEEDKALLIKVVQRCLETDKPDYNILAQSFGVSRRTIIRVLEEAGVDPQIRRQKNLRQKKLAPAASYELPLWTGQEGFAGHLPKVDESHLDEIIANHKPTFWEKLKAKVYSFFRAVNGY